jgi:hypothetical protein
MRRRGRCRDPIGASCSISWAERPASRRSRLHKRGGNTCLCPGGQQLAGVSVGRKCDDGVGNSDSSFERAKIQYVKLSYRLDEESQVPQFLSNPPYSPRGRRTPAAVGRPQHGTRFRRAPLPTGVAWHQSKPPALTRRLTSLWLRAFPEFTNLHESCGRPVETDAPCRAHCVRDFALTLHDTRKNPVSCSLEKNVRCSIPERCLNSRPKRVLRAD